MRKTWHLALFCVSLTVALLLTGCSSMKRNAGWENCTVRVMTYSAGTCFYEFRADGTVRYFDTSDRTDKDLVTYEEFTEGSVLVPLKAERQLTDKEYAELCEHINTIYTDGGFVDMGAPENLQELLDASECGSEITIVIDGKRVDYSTRAWPEYPSKEYTEFVNFVLSEGDISVR